MAEISVIYYEKTIKKDGFNSVTGIKVFKNIIGHFFEPFHSMGSRSTRYNPFLYSKDLSNLQYEI